MAGAAYGTKIWFAGGCTTNSAKSTIDLYDVSTRAVTSLSLSVARCNIGVAVVADLMIFAGGTTTNSASQTVSAVVDIRNIQAGTWTATTLPGGPRARVATAVLGSKAYFGGGSTGSEYSNAVDIYDASSGLWSSATLSVARTYVAAAVSGSAIVFVGGATSSASDVIDILATTTNEVTSSTLSAGRTQSTAVAVDDTVYVFGGNSGGVDFSTMQTVNVVPRTVFKNASTPLGAASAVGTFTGTVEPGATITASCPALVQDGPSYESSSLTCFNSPNGLDWWVVSVALI